MKIKLFLDFDNVVINSDKIIYDMYRKYYGHLDKEVQRMFFRSNSWDYSTELPIIFEDNDRDSASDIIETFYKSDDFFERIEISEEDKGYLAKLNEEFDLYICTIGTQGNISKKTKWCKTNLPFINQIIGLQLDPFEHTKELIDMSGGIIVDDKKTNLLTSSASIKIKYHRGSSDTLLDLVTALEEEAGIKILKKTS